MWGVWAGDGGIEGDTGNLPMSTQVAGARGGAPFPSEPWRNSEKEGIKEGEGARGSAVTPSGWRW